MKQLLGATTTAWFAQGFSLAASLAIDVSLARSIAADPTGPNPVSEGKAWGRVVARTQSLQDGGADPESLRGLLVACGCRFRRPLFHPTQPRPRPAGIAAKVSPITATIQVRR